MMKKKGRNKAKFFRYNASTESGRADSILSEMDALSLFMCNTDSKYHFSSRICHFERSEHDYDEKFCEGSLHMDFNLCCTGIGIHRNMGILYSLISDVILLCYTSFTL